MRRINIAASIVEKRDLLNDLKNKLILTERGLLSRNKTKRITCLALATLRLANLEIFQA